MSEWDWAETYRAWDTWSKHGMDGDSQDLKRGAEAARKCSGCRGLDRTDERRVFEMPTEEKVRWCDVYRRRGDCMIKEGQYFRASLWYRRSLSYYEYTFPDDKDTIKILESTRLATLLGLAECDFRSKLYLEVLNDCYQALRIDANNLTALVRRAATFRLLDRYDEARRDLDKALSIQSDQVDALTEYDKLRAREKAYAVRSRVQSRQIINGLNGKANGTFQLQTEQEASSQGFYQRLLREESTGDRVFACVCAAYNYCITGAVLPRPLSSKDRDALDDLYVPVASQSALEELLQSCLADSLHPERKVSAPLSTPSLQT